MSSFRLLFVTVSLLAPGVASAGAYHGIEGDIYVRIADPNSVAMNSDTWQSNLGLTQIAVGFGADMTERVCGVAADEIRSALNDTSIPAKYVPSVVTCEQVSDDGTTAWLLWERDNPASGLYNFAAGTAYVVRIHVTDYNAPAIVAKGAAAVKIGRALGLSVNGRVNVQVELGLWEKMSAKGIDFYTYNQR